MSIYSINGVLHIIILTVSNVFRRNFSRVISEKNAFVAPLQLLGKTQKNRISFLYIWPDDRGPGPLFTTAGAGFQSPRTFLYTVSPAGGDR